MNALGFGFHTAKKWQAARTAFASGFVLIGLIVMIATEPGPWRETLRQSPAMFFAAAIFFLFTLVLLIQLVHVLRTRFVLEFGADGLIDRRRLRPVFVAYRDIEIFSPVPEDLFRVEPSLAELRAKTGTEDYLSLACRLNGNGDDFVFFEKVEAPDFEMQEQIVVRLRQKISKFDLLFHDEGDDVGEFDETNA